MRSSWSHDQRAVAGDGEVLFYRHHRGGGDAGRAPILVYHGLVSTTTHWPFFVEHFVRARDVVTWDYRGHGGTPVPRDLDSVSVTGFADDGATVQRAAVDARPAVVTGLSFGVQTALEHYRRHPESVRALVLICGTYGHPLDRLSQKPALRGALARTMRTLAQSGPLGRGLMALARAPGLKQLAYLTGGAHRELCPPEALDELFAHTARLDPAVVGRVVSSYFTHSAEDMLGEVRVPTLIIAGDKDQLTPVACAESMRDRIRGAELRVFPGHSHVVQLERPAEVHAVIDDFLARHAL